VYSLRPIINPNSKAELDKILVDEELIEGLDVETKEYTVSIPYTKEIPELTATAKERSFTHVVQPSIENGLRGVVRVFSEDGTNVELYTVQYDMVAPKFSESNLTLGTNEGVVGGKIDLTLENLLESGEVIHPALTQTNYKIEPENGIAMVDDSLHLYEAGEYVVVAETTYEDITILSNEVVITVTDNSAIEPIQSLLPVNV